MVLHQILAHDDDWATTGTQIADTDFLDDDGKIDTDANNQNPILRHIELFVRDTFAATVTKPGYATLQMNPWPNTSRITIIGQIMNAILTDSGAATESLLFRDNVRLVSFPMNLPLSKGDDWVSANSKIYAPADNADMQLLFSYQYGQAYPYQGGHIIWIRKVADAAEATTDTWDEAFSDVLTGETPGLDPAKNYILRGIGHEAGAAAKLGIAARAGKQSGGYKIIGPAGPDNGMCLTVYLNDGIPCRGDDGFIAETCGGAADTPYVWLGFEEVGTPTPRLAPTGGAPAVRRVAPAGLFGMFTR